MKQTMICYAKTKFHVQVVQLERENATLKRRVEALPRSGSGYAGKPIAGIAAKQANTCRDWNNAAGCSRTEVRGHCTIGMKKLKHACSKVVDNRMCWDNSHKESEHS